MGEAATIFKIWGNHSGYVSLPRKLRSNDVKGPKSHGGKWEEGKMYKWPEDKASVVAWIQESHKKKYDLYWCPCVFSQPRRVKENIEFMDVLYADLDEVNPGSLPVNLKPTMAWESSPGRFAAVWKLNRLTDAEDAENLNKRLTYAIGADHGGWDLTQVLRVPGLHNYKYEGAPKGKLLWYDDTEVSSAAFRDLPDVDMTDLEELSPDPDIILESEPALLPELVRPYLSKINSKTLELLFASGEDVLLNDRSAKLWELECKLLESGVPRDTVVKLVAACNWNKYKGRRDEVKRILTEVDKAAESVDNMTISAEAVSEKTWTSYGDMMGKEMTNPGWMIEGVWQRASHGMIAGEPKTYKSVIVTDMAVSVASGTPFLGQFAVHHQGPVLMIQEENSPWLVQDRVAKIANSRGFLAGNVKVVNRKVNVQFPPILPIHFLNNQGFDLTLEEDQKFLEASMAEIEPVLVIFDSLYLMLGGKDENSAKDLRPVLNWLLHIRYKYHCSVVLLHHWNKNGKSERGGQRMLGSVLFHAWVESAMYTAVVDEEKHEIEVDREFRSFTKPAKVGIQFHMGEPGDSSYSPILTDIISGDVSKAGDLVHDFIILHGAVSIQDITDNLKGVKKRELKPRLDKLVSDGLVTEIAGIYRPAKKGIQEDEQDS